MQPPPTVSNASKRIRGMPPAHQQQKRLLLLLKRGGGLLCGHHLARQTLTYDALARRIKRGGTDPLAKPSTLVARWCQHHSLPALASSVVE